MNRPERATAWERNVFPTAAPEAQSGLCRPVLLLEQFKATVVCQAAPSKQVHFPWCFQSFSLSQSAVKVSTLHRARLHSVRISTTERGWQWANFPGYGKLDPGLPTSQSAGVFPWFIKSRCSLFPVHVNMRKARSVLAPEWRRKVFLSHATPPAPACLGDTALLPGSLAVSSNPGGWNNLKIWDLKVFAFWHGSFHYISIWHAPSLSGTWSGTSLMLQHTSAVCDLVRLCFCFTLLLPVLLCLTYADEVDRQVTDKCPFLGFFLRTSRLQWFHQGKQTKMSSYRTESDFKAGR